MNAIHLSSIFQQPFSSFLLFSLPKSKPFNNSRIKASSSEKEGRNKEIRVCTERACRKQGSLDTLQVLSGIVPPFVSVNSCGCLGRCGAGPNVVVLPGPVFIKHCGTPTRAAEVMAFVCFGRDDVEEESRRSLEALALRKRAEDEMGNGNFCEAHRLLSQAIDLKPFGGVHIMLKDRRSRVQALETASGRNARSAVELAMGNLAEALDDAKEALTIAPNYPEGYISQGDAFMALDQVDAAEKSYSMALELDPSFRRSKSFKGALASVSRVKEALGHCSQATELEANCEEPNIFLAGIDAVTEENISRRNGIIGTLSISV
ncbi:putative WW domain-containing oxidoreductase-like [Capsicum annuum]|nr:putative WW domain-containing oxidoreductase-like [Capsicum annuum]